MLSATELRLIDALHGGFPLQDRPFAQVGSMLGMHERDVMDTLSRLLQQGDLTRFGPLFQIERAGGRFVLAAMQVPEARYDDVTSLVNALPEVAHNYRRDHRLNMWFVVATESYDLADQALSRISTLTGLDVLAFPKEREYFVELRLPLLGALPQHSQPRCSSPLQGVRLDQHRSQSSSSHRRDDGRMVASAAAGHSSRSLSSFERELMQVTQAGLPITPRPYVEMGQQLGVSADDVITGLSTLLADGVIRRIGAVPHHYRLGFVANGMSVWDVDDAQVDVLGEQVSHLPGVSHCYRRPRHGQAWPYNLFAMLHGRNREEVQSQAEQLSALLGAACRSHDILYSSAVLKKTGLRLRSDQAPSAVEG